MPVQKGKHRKRPRNRGQTRRASSIERAAPQASAHAEKRPIMRRGWQGPPWLNLTLGLCMVVAGLAFFFLQPKSVGLRDKILLLVAYMVLAGFYLFRAYRARGT